MLYTEMKQVLDRAYKIACAERVAPVPMFWSPPGCGKTQKIYQWIAERGLVKHTLLGSTLAPTDVVCYFPDAGSKKLVACFNERLPDANEVPDEAGIIFLDEAPNTHQEVMKPLMKLINEGELDGLVIPKNVMFILAGNRTTDRTGANQLLSAFSNRLDHYDFTVDHEEVADYFAGKDYDPLLVSYFYAAPDQVHVFEPQHRTWANPRTWEFLALKMKYGDGPVSLRDIIAVVGESAGKQVYSYFQTAEQLHSKDDIIKDPETISLPEKSSHEWQMMAMLSTAMKEKEFEPIHRYIKRFSLNRQVLFIKLVRRRKDIISAIEKTTPYKQWVTTKGLYEMVTQNV